MRTGKNIATNNFVVRLWSVKQFPENSIHQMTGTITDVKSKEVKHFHSAGGFLKKLELLNKKAEKARD